MKQAAASTVSVLCAAILGFGVQLSVQAAPALCGPPPPNPIDPVQFEKLGASGARLTWWSQGGYYTDIVRGSLSVLADTNGDFGTAIERCVLEDFYQQDASSFDDADVPASGEGYWYLLRADQYTGCPNGEGTYNSLQGHQVGDRNVEIQTSGRDCTCFLLYGSPGYCTVHQP